MSYAPGDQIVFRDVRGGVIRAVSTAVVVEHSSEQLITWIPIGSPLLLPADTDDHLVRTDDFDHLKQVAWDSWGGPLFIWPSGAAYSVRLSWRGSEAGRELDHWYVNLHLPLRPTPLGFDTTDLVLDVVVAPDRRSWSWKDEQAFETARASGQLDAGAATLARTTGLEQAERALAGEWPFEERWVEWRPDPTWRVPVLPPGVV